MRFRLFALVRYEAGTISEPKLPMSHAATKILQCTRRGMCPIHVRQYTPTLMAFQ